MRRATGAVLAACLLAVAVAACGQPGFPARVVGVAASAAPAVAVPVPRGGYLGVYERSDRQSYGPVDGYAKAVGYQPSIVAYFSRWGQPFPAGFVSRAHAHGAIPLIQIAPRASFMRGIAAGRYDGYLRWYARAVAGYGNAVIIGFARDMNSRTYRWGWTHTPARVWVKAWRRVVTIFRQQYVPNVTWLWTISQPSKNTAPLGAYWPGAQYVNWVGIDGFYGTRSQTFETAFAPAIRAARELTRDPILLSEVGISPAADQPRKIPDLFAGIRRYHLTGLVWYDVGRHGRASGQDWRLERTPAALGAFRRGMAAMLAPPGPG